MGYKDIISKSLIKQIAIDLGNILFKLNIRAGQLELLETDQAIPNLYWQTAAQNAGAY